MSKLFKYYGIVIKKGEYIFREGDEADSLYLIHKGKIKICKSTDRSEKRIQVLGEGEFVGEMAIINSLPRSADAIAMEDSELIKMNRESFNATIEDNHQFALSFIKFLSSRLRDTTEQLAALTENDRDQHVFSEMMKDMINFGKKDQSGNWTLLKLDGFLQRYNEKHLMGDIEIMTVLDDIIKKGYIKIKSDSKKNNWIAVKND